MGVIVVGAGLAGLICARLLLRAGVDVTVFEASDGVGGRVRSDEQGGFILDRGFQVLFTAYPAARRHLDFDRLDLRSYDPGAVICRAGTRQILSDPLRDASALIPSVLSTIVSPIDKALTFKLAVEMRAKSVRDIMDSPDETTETFLRNYGFSEAYIDNFVRPFFGGIFLRSDMQTSARAFQFDWKMLSSGETVVPARGMGQISAQLAEELFAAKVIRLHTPASALEFRNGRVSGIRTSDGEIAEADTVILAVPAPEAARLTGRTELGGGKIPMEKVGVTTLYFGGNAPPWSHKKIMLNANVRAVVNNASLVSNVAPEQVPPGKHLLAASVLGVSEEPDDALAEWVLADLRRMMAGDKHALAALETFDLLRVYRIAYGQFWQPPGIYETLPENDSGIPGLLFASEFTTASSQNAAMRSGEKAAALVLSPNR